MKKTSATVFAALLVMGSSPSWAWTQVAANDSAVAPQGQVVQRAIGDVSLPVVRYSADNQVSYADLNLANPSDVAVLDGRIKEAALAVCGHLSARFPVSVDRPKLADRNCVKTATDDAMATARMIAASASGRKVANNN